MTTPREFVVAVLLEGGVSKMTHGAMRLRIAAALRVRAAALTRARWPRSAMVGTSRRPAFPSPHHRTRGTDLCRRRRRGCLVPQSWRRERQVPAPDRLPASPAFCSLGDAGFPVLRRQTAARSLSGVRLLWGRRPRPSGPAAALSGAGRWAASGTLHCRPAARSRLHFCGAAAPAPTYRHCCRADQPLLTFRAVPKPSASSSRAEGVDSAIARSSGAHPSGFRTARRQCLPWCPVASPGSPDPPISPATSHRHRHGRAAREPWSGARLSAPAAPRPCLAAHRDQLVGIAAVQRLQHPWDEVRGPAPGSDAAGTLLSRFPPPSAGVLRCASVHQFPTPSHPTHPSHPPHPSQPPFPPSHPCPVPLV